MKLAFSSVACPGWDLPTMIEKAKAFGYDGIELGGLDGDANLPVGPDLADNPEKIVQLMRQAKLELVCLATDTAFHMPHAREVAESQARVRKYIEFAAKLECPFVRVFGAEIPSRPLLGIEQRETVLDRIAKAIRELVPCAVEHGVTILIENGGDFADSPSIWHIVDVADSPAVRCCWNPLVAMTHHERPTRSVPRLGARLGLVRISDGKLGNTDTIGSYVLPGQGDVEIRTLVQILKGIAFRGHLVFDWPKTRNTMLADPDEALPAAAQYLRGLLDEETIPLTAYKTDKYKPRQGYEFATS